MPRKSTTPAPDDLPEPTPEVPEDPFHDLELLSTLQIFDLISRMLPTNNLPYSAWSYLRGRVEEVEQMNDQAREALTKLDSVVNKLSAPANRLGTLLDLPKRELALVVSGGSEYYCQVDPRLAHDKLLIGTRVLLNEAYVVVGDLGFETNGPILKVLDALEDGRLRVGSEGSQQNFLVHCSTPLLKERLKKGLEVRLDPSQRVALEVIAAPELQHHLLEKVPELPWEKVGGQHQAVSALRDAVELPLLHADLFKSYRHNTPKGFLLYGPPGCGKTLLGKATAYNLTRQLQEKTGKARPEFFLHIKGPEILNMWVGESERQVRELFAQAREKSREGFLPFLFIDEAESILGTRRAGRYGGILNTLVPMFCTEMDGIESLNEMVIILASNRADMIDPAILRPGRIDRKIKVSRPDRAGSAEIYKIYLGVDLPYSEEIRDLAPGSTEGAIQALISKILEEQFAHRESNRFLEVTLRSGRREYLYRGDLISGAIIASVVERAKSFAIKRAVEKSENSGLKIGDFLQALELEYRENDIFPPSDVTEDWLKLVDYDPLNVVKISPIRARRENGFAVI